MFSKTANVMGKAKISSLLKAIDSIMSNTSDVDIRLILLLCKDRDENDDWDMCAAIRLKGVRRDFSGIGCVGG